MSDFCISFKPHHSYTTPNKPGWYAVGVADGGLYRYWNGSAWSVTYTNPHITCPQYKDQSEPTDVSWRLLAFDNI